MIERGRIWISTTSSRRSIEPPVRSASRRCITLGQPDAVEGRRWFVVFPMLTAAALVSIALLPMSPAFLVVMLFVNMAARFLTDRRIGGSHPASGSACL